MFCRDSSSSRPKAVQYQFKRRAVINDFLVTPLASRALLRTSSISARGVCLRAVQRCANGLLILRTNRFVSKSYRHEFLAQMVSKRYHMAMTDNASDTEDIAELLVYLGRAARGTDAGSDLTAAQWTAMRFFARANHFSRTPSAFASFHATTRGTASQTIKSLMLKSYLVRHEAVDDRRSVRLDLTSSGRSIIRHDPLRKLTEAIDKLESRLRKALRQSLPALAGELAKIRETVAFGTCGDCRHFVCCGAVSYCACVGAELAPGDLGCLCVNFAASERRKTAMPGPKSREIS